MRKSAGPEVIFDAFQLKQLAYANTGTRNVKPNDLLGKYDSFYVFWWKNIKGKGIFMWLFWVSVDSKRRGDILLISERRLIV